MPDPIICFGQQPCGIFPKRFLFAKIRTARQLQREIGGAIVFFYRDSDHDPRETTTVLHDHHTGRKFSLNFVYENRFVYLIDRLSGDGFYDCATRVPVYEFNELA
ncbi:MAG TPA: hypothetical protein VLK27_09030, partial [Chthoniobacterales bacterium]|nr:hypothetical protein [Chthoniobacterales bacterium]